MRLALGVVRAGAFDDALRKFLILEVTLAYRGIIFSPHGVDFLGGGWLVRGGCNRPAPWRRRLALHAFVARGASEKRGRAAALQNVD